MKECKWKVIYRKGEPTEITLATFRVYVHAEKFVALFPDYDRERITVENEAEE